MLVLSANSIVRSGEGAPIKFIEIECIGCLKQREAMKKVGTSYSSISIRNSNTKRKYHTVLQTLAVCKILTHKLNVFLLHWSSCQPIFHLNANPFKLQLCVGHDSKRNHFALPSATF